MDELLQKSIDSIISDYRNQVGLECKFFEIESLESDDIGTCELCNFCKIIQSRAEGRQNCFNQRKSAAFNAITDHTWKLSVCHAGLLEWVAPVCNCGHEVGFLVSGGVTTNCAGFSKILSQKESYLSHYQLDQNELNAALDEIPLISKNKAKPYAELLLSLSAIYIPWDLPETNDNVSDTPFSEYTAFLKDRNIPFQFEMEYPLSYYIYDNNFDSESLSIFWKLVETKANNVFSNIMSGRIMEARCRYNEIMQLVYSETDLRRAQIGAEILFHILFLKYYNAVLYDTRFYRLAYDTVSHLYQAKSLGDIPKIMTDSFDRLYFMYNVKDGPTRKNTISKIIMSYIDENYSSEIRLEDFKKIVYMSPTYVSRLFKQETNFTIKWYINNVRMQHAQELLLNSQIPIKDIGPAVGYNDLRGFYKMFKKHFGVTCSEMREKYTIIGIR